MNLKEAFRYQNFLDNLFQTALIRLTVKACSLSTVKKHLTSAVIPEKADFDEVVEPLYEYSADNLILLIDWLITEKEKLTKAIWEAKNALGFNIDAAIEAKSADAAETVKVAVKKLDQAQAKGIMHKNAVARKKSQLANRLNKAN